MSPSQKAIIILIISVAAVAGLVSLSFGYVTPSVNEKIIQITEADIRFSGTDADIVIYYEADPIVKLYILLFGSHNLEKDIRNLVSSLGETGDIVFNKDQASVHVSNISEEKNGYFLHDSCNLNETVGKLVLIYPDGREKILLNASKTPDTFY